MKTNEILSLLYPKNQNLPALRVDDDFKKIPLVVIPDFSAKKDEVKEVVKNGQIIRSIGLGKREEVTARTMRRFFRKSYLEALKSKPQKIALVCPREYL